MGLGGGAPKGTMANGTTRRRWRRIAAVGAVAATVPLASVGCSAARDATDGGARADAEGKAEAALRQAELIGNWRPPVERAARMQQTAEVLSYDGDAESSHYLIRTTGEGRDGFGSVHRTTVCFGIAFDAWTGRLDRGAACPADAVALEVVAPPTPTLPPTVVEDLTAQLSAVAAAIPAGSRPSEPAVRAAVAEGDVAVAADGAVGVARSAGRSCVLGRITATGQVEVWVPPRVTVQPGELGCTGTTAANGLATTSPH